MVGQKCTRLLHSALRNGSRFLNRSHHAAVVSEYGKIEYREMKDNSPREGEILIDVESAGVNAADMKMMNGTFHRKPQFPFTPGFEMAGNVKSVGKGVNKWKEGDRVVVLRSNGTGAFSEDCIVDTNVDVIVPLPYSIDYETAAAVSTAYGTSYLALEKMAKNREGANVLVLSSRGMIAFAAIDLAHNIFKAHVIAASDDELKLDKLRDTGVSKTINYKKEKLMETIHKSTMNHGVDVAIDTVGGAVFTQAMDCVRPGGSLFSLGFTSGEIPSISLLDLHRTQVSISGIWLGAHPKKETETIIEMLLGLFDQQYLQARIEAKYSLKDIGKCMEDINDNKLFGKVLINPKD
ncbi:hypothetical protein PENTCL1PPCAC_17984 [Pristionchus entomophagus]|uniref:Enoyl reductase (ER) domain-containing protein n=1 Tax=Pristionchus entomophagus TaxID=358040 RepID=A0AAV5TNE2_9BILA|nr:hypothetical protein PENTCL1PPCAC_17984 [Pristionchus entomophagus]